MRTAFLMRSPRILPILLWVICLLVPAEAQHGGGGGGHSGGGHFGGGHSSGRHSAASQGRGHFGWLHFWSGRHSSGRAEARASSTFTSDVSPHGPSRLGTFASLAGTRFISRTPSTLLWSPPLFHAAPAAGVFSLSSTLHRHRDFFFNRYSRFSSSGCFLNGLNQVCFFEPFLPLLAFAGYFDPFDFGFGEDSPDLGNDNDLNSQAPGQGEISAIPPALNSPDDDTAEGNSSALSGAMSGAPTGQQSLDNGVFLLVLKNGTSHAVTDYWVADGYLEYISPDGSRSHLPLEALDLQNTVKQNAPRGRPFVLRFAPAQNR
ncbi:MAG: hypothetical protein WCD47_14315 [Candidatus Sulfotelmatobacter sp.]